MLRIVSLLVSVTSRARLRHSWISPLHLAAEHNRHTVAAVLLKTGADVNATLAPSHSTQYADGRATALYFAIANGGSRTAEVLLNAGASVSLDPLSPLLMAVRQGCVSTVSSAAGQRGRRQHQAPVLRYHLPRCYRTLHEQSASAQMPLGQWLPGPLLFYLHIRQCPSPSDRRSPPKNCWH